MEQPDKPPSKLKGLKVVSLLTLLSRITGLARDALMAWLFGAGWILDAFTVAFRIPNLFRRLFGEGAMAAAFLPEFLKTDEQVGRDAAARLFSGVAWKLLKILLAFTVGIEIAIAIPYLTLNMSDRSTLLCELCLILMPYLLLICMAGLYAAALNGVHHFFYPALAPVLLNLIWLAGGLLAANQLATGEAEARTISAFILVGGMLQLGLLVHKLRKFGIHIQSPSNNAETISAQTMKVFRAMGPVLLGLSIAQVNGLFDSLLAWGLSSGNLDGIDLLSRFRLPEGTAGALYLGQRLFQFPLGVFAVALGTVLFPRFARHAQAGDHTELSRDVVHGLQLVFTVGIPASVGLWFMAAPITDLLFRHGQFDATAAGMTSSMIAAHGLGVWVFSVLLIVNRVFYAANDQVTPMRQGLICVGMNIVFDIVLLPVLGSTALPIASILAAVFQLGLALEVLRKRFLIIGRNAFVPLLWRIAICTLIMNAVGLATLYATSTISEQLGELPYRMIKVVLPVALSAATYAGGLLICGISPLALLREPHLQKQGLRP